MKKPSLELFPQEPAEKPAVPEINLGDRCMVLIDGELVECQVTHVTPCYFQALTLTEPKLWTLPPGIRKEKFRPVENKAP